MLAGKNMDELEIMAKALAKTKSVDFSGMGNPHVNSTSTVDSQPDILLPPDVQ
jgi:hypothetical protein